MAMVIIGLMKDPKGARGAVNALRNAGFELEEIDSVGPVAECLAELGVPEGEVGTYAEGVRRGGTIVGVAANDEIEAVDAAHLMAVHGAVDRGACAQSWDPQAVELIFGAANPPKEKS
jgi:hypothetical protein